MRYPELAQLLIGAGSVVGVFALILHGDIGATEGLGYVMSLLAGLGIGYTNGVKSNGTTS